MYRSQPEHKYVLCLNYQTVFTAVQKQLFKFLAIDIKFAINFYTQKALYAVAWYNDTNGEFPQLHD